VRRIAIITPPRNITSPRALRYTSPVRRTMPCLALLAAHCADPSPSVVDSGAETATPASCELRVTPSDPQHIRTSERVTFTARVTPAGSATEVRFALVGDALDGSLSATRVPLAPDGSAGSELTAPSSAASFRVRASARCAADAYVDVSVGDRGFGALVAEAVYRGARQPERLSVGVYRAVDCVSVTATGPDRAAQVPLPGGSVRFGELPAGIDYVVRGLAIGRDGLELATACAGPARVDVDAESHATLVFGDAPLRLADRYGLALSFDLSSVATASAVQWGAPVSAEIARAGGDAAVLGFELSSAVAAAATPALRERDRAAFEAAWRDRLAASFAMQLTRRDAELGPLFARLGAAVGAVAASARSSSVATVSTNDRARYSVEDVHYVLDPETPDVRGDDVDVPAPAAARLRVAAGLRDGLSVDVDGYPLPWNVIARSALGAWLSRQGVSSSGEYAAVAVCPVLVPIARGNAGACNDACVTAACRRALATLGGLFESAITTQDPPRSLADLRLSGTPQPVAGTLTIERLAGIATGGFREDASTSIAASAQLTRVASP
jgi:hypothetical protein